MLGPSAMRAVKAVFLVLGAVLLGVLVYRVGAAPILETLRRLTWWQFALVCLPYAVIMAADTLGWRFAFARDRAPFHRLYGARLAGEALNIVTALGAVGGEAAKAWLLRRDVTYEESVPSVVIAKTSITLAQALFLVVGLAVAWSVLPPGTEILRVMTWLLLGEVLAVAGFVGVQVSGLVARGGRLLRLVGAIADTAYAETLDRALRDYYRTEWRRLALSLGFHLTGWILGILDALVILWALGLDVPVATATIIEAFGSGVRFATFLVPANLGSSEAANAGAFAGLGLGAAAGLAFSFVRRARQAVWVGVGLAVLVAMRWSAARAARAG
jgi:glycosyltransferase 2 family protein